MPNDYQNLSDRGVAPFGSVMANGNPEIRRQNPDNTPVDERVKLVHEFRSMAERSPIRQQAEKWWAEADKLYEGRHWPDDMDYPSWRAQLVINLVVPVVETFQAMLIESLPEIEILPRDPEDKYIAQSIDRFLRHEWMRNNWTATIGMACEKVVTRNIAFIKTYWDIHGDAGRGAVRLEAVSAFDLLLHPNARVRDNKLITKFAIHQFWMTREEIMAKYRVDPIPSQDQRTLLSQIQGSSVSPIEQMRNDDLGTGKSTPYGSSAGTSTRSKNPLLPETGIADAIRVSECWYMDDTLVETEEIDDVARRGSDDTVMLKYPNGRILTEANDMILYDDVNKSGFFGFVPFSGSPDPERIYRKSMVNHIADPQMEYNKRRSQIADHAAMQCNPAKEVYAQSGIDTDTVTNQPGAIYINNGIAGQPGIRNIEAEQLGPEVEKSALLAHEDIEEISGIYEVQRGESATNADSGVAIERLNQRGRGRSNMKNMFLDGSVRQVCFNVISMFLDFVSDERKYRFISPEAQQEYGSFNPVEMLLPKRETAIAEVQILIGQLEAEMAMAIREGAEDEVIQQVQMLIEQQEREIMIISQMPAHDLVSFDVEVSTHTRNITHAGQATLSLQLHQQPSSTGMQGVIDDMALLEALEYPGWQMIVARQQEAARLAAEEAAAAAEREHEMALELEMLKQQGDLDKQKLANRKPQGGSK